MLRVAHDIACFECGQMCDACIVFGNGPEAYVVCAHCLNVALGDLLRDNCSQKLLSSARRQAGVPR